MLPLTGHCSETRYNAIGATNSGFNLSRNCFFSPIFFSTWYQSPGENPKELSPPPPAAGTHLRRQQPLDSSFPPPTRLFLPSRAVSQPPKVFPCRRNHRSSPLDVLPATGVPSSGASGHRSPLHRRKGLPGPPVSPAEALDLSSPAGRGFQRPQVRRQGQSRPSKPPTVVSGHVLGLLRIFSPCLCVDT